MNSPLTTELEDIAWRGVCVLRRAGSNPSWLELDEVANKVMTRYHLDILTTHATALRREYDEGLYRT